MIKKKATDDAKIRLSKYFVALVLRPVPQAAAKSQCSNSDASVEGQEKVKVYKYQV